MARIDAIHLRSHAEGVCRDYEWTCIIRICNENFPAVLRDMQRTDKADEIYAYSLDILCLMALTEALELEYGYYIGKESLNH